MIDTNLVNLVWCLSKDTAVDHRNIYFDMAHDYFQSIFVMAVFGEESPEDTPSPSVTSDRG